MGSFNEDAVRALSEFLKEPNWLRDFRLQSFRAYASLPQEKNPLYTKYAYISSFDGSKFSVLPQKSKVDLRSFFKDYLTGRENNIILQGNETEVHSELEESVSVVLDRVSQLPIAEWSYKGYSQRHIGAMAQDFHALFPLNDSDKVLNDADLHGVELAAIQGLNQKLNQKDAEIQDLKARLEKLEQLVTKQIGGAQ